MKKNYQVSDIKVNKNNPSRVKLHLSNGLHVETDYSLVINLELYIGKTISKQMLEIIEQNSKLSSAKNDAIRFLSYRPRSKWEIENKLHRNKYKPSIIENTINWLEENNFINDRDFAINWIRYQISKKPAGKLKLRNELNKKGIDREIIDSVINSFFEQEEDELTLANQLIRKKQFSLQSKDIQLDPTKLISLLKRRGFSNVVIKRVCEKYSYLENTEL